MLHVNEAEPSFKANMSFDSRHLPGDLPAKKLCSNPNVSSIHVHMIYVYYIYIYTCTYSLFDKADTLTGSYVHNISMR